MRIPNCIELGEKIESSYKPGAFHDWKEYLLGILLLPIGIGLIILITTEVNRLTTTYFFTDRRIIQESNVFSKKISIPYHLVEELHFQQTKADMYFNTGTIIVETKRNKKNEMVMKSIVNPYETKKLLEKKVQEARRKKEDLRGYIE